VHSAGVVAPAATEQSAQPPASPAPAPAPSAHPAPAPAPFARPAPAALAPAPAGPERAPTTDRAAARPGADFAVSTRPLRTRAEADQVRVAMQALLRSVAAEGVHVDLMPEGDDWRVLALPFSSRAEAEKARALLASRGIRMTVIAF
jgi:cell division septation protein DedD